MSAPNLPSFVGNRVQAPTTVPVAVQAQPAPAPSFGEFADFATAKISGESAPKAQPGDYECECTGLVRYKKFLIFEYVITDVLNPNSESPVGFSSSILRDISDPNYFGYTAKIALSIAGVDVNDQQQLAASQPYLPAMLAAALTGVPQSFGGATIERSALVGRKFRLRVVPQEERLGKSGKSNIDKNTGRPYHKEIVSKAE